MDMHAGMSYCKIFNYVARNTVFSQPYIILKHHTAGSCTLTLNFNLCYRNLMNYNNPYTI